MFTDIPKEDLENIYAEYRASFEGTSEDFVKDLWEALSKGTPRIMRDVDHLRLE